LIQRNVYITMLLIFAIVSWLSLSAQGVSNPEADSLKKMNEEVEPLREKITKSKLKFQTTTSLGLLGIQAVGVGMGIHNSKNSMQFFVMASFGVGILGVSEAVYIQQTAYHNPQPVGRFYVLEYGAMNRNQLFMYDQGENPHKSEVIPYVSIGLGKSYKIGKDSYFRYSFDAGVKISPVNFNLTWVF
jgi:hypothetical protein